MTPNDPKLGVIATKVATAVTSRKTPAAIVAAATFVSAACGAEGLMMLVHVKDATAPAVSPPAVKVTVKTFDARAAVAAGEPVIPVKSETAMVAVEVNPVSVTTTLLKLATVVGVNVTVALPVDPATADAKVTAKFGVICGSDPTFVVSKVALAVIVAAAIVFDAT